LAADRFRVLVDELPLVRDAGVVDQQVNLCAVGERDVDDLVHAGGDGEIGRRDPHGHAMGGTKLASDVLEALPACGQRARGAPLAQPAAGRTARRYRRWRQSPAQSFRVL
jgi:hypothetical protein